MANRAPSPYPELARLAIRRPMNQLAVFACHTRPLVISMSGGLRDQLIANAILCAFAQQSFLHSTCLKFRGEYQRAPGHRYLENGQQRRKLRPSPPGAPDRAMLASGGGRQHDATAKDRAGRVDYG